MWRALPATGSPIREVRIEGSGRDRDLVITPISGERLRLVASGDINVETSGRVVVRTTPVDLKSLRVTFSGERIVLAQADVLFDGSEQAWENLWRQARMRSRPWWNEQGDELDLEWPMQAKLKIAGP
ncbi:MAG: hypothetical protein KIT84_03665 [Labilithrix sp.]|nr:hypothetical protein [Labilithrix sp.]MCW5810081.1 hypothetical protein [Labilithrix sp.]